MKSDTIKTLSIQIRLSGLSFCILNRTAHKIELLKDIAIQKKGTPFELLNELKKEIENNPELQQEFESVLCIHQNELATLIPKELFHEDQMANYLKFNAKILKTDFITYDLLKNGESVSVYVPWVNINNYLFDTFGSFEYNHASTILIDTLLRYPDNDLKTDLFINVDELHFEIIALKDHKLLLYNTFDYSTPEDFIYYILFTLEQLKFDPETVRVKLSGAINQDNDLFNILYKYVRYVDFIAPLVKYRFEETQKPQLKHNQFLILNSFN